MDDQASSPSQTTDEETLDPDEAIVATKDARTVAMETDAAEFTAALRSVDVAASAISSQESLDHCDSILTNTDLGVGVTSSGVTDSEADDQEGYPNDVINNGSSFHDVIKDSEESDSQHQDIPERDSEDQGDNCNHVNGLFNHSSQSDTDCNSLDAADVLTPDANGHNECIQEAENAVSHNKGSVAPLNEDTDDSQMTFIEENNKNDSDATAPSSVNASPRAATNDLVSNSHFGRLEKEFCSSPRGDSSDRSLPASREGSVTRDGSVASNAASPERTSVVIKRNTNRRRGRESILQRLTDSLLAKKERDFKAQCFSDSESNGASPMHFSDSNDSFTMGPEAPVRRTLDPASVYDKISESDSSNHGSPPTLPPRDLNESGPRKPNIRWNFNRVKQLRNVISNILDRETSALERETNMQNSGPVVNGNDHSVSEHYNHDKKSTDNYVNGETKPKFGHKRKKASPLKQPKPASTTNGIIKCKFCPFSKELGIGAKSAVQRHERCHYTHGPFTCKLCTFSTNNWNSIKMHRQLHIRVGDCMPEEDCIIRNFTKKEKKKRAKPVGRAKKDAQEKKNNEVEYTAFQRSLNEEALSSTPRLYASQSIYPGAPDDYGLLDGYPSATPVNEQPVKQMPSLARITSPVSSPGRSASPAPCLTPTRNHHSPSPLARISQTSSPCRTPIHMTTLHPVDLTSQALDLTAPALDLSARRDFSGSDQQDSSMDLSIPKDTSHEDRSYSEGQPDFPVDLSVSKSSCELNSFPEVVHYSDSNSGYHSQVSDSWHNDNQMPFGYNRSRSPTPQRNGIDSHSLNSSYDQEPDHMNSLNPINCVNSAPTTPKTSPVPKDKAEDEKYQAKCPFCPFEAAGHKAARAVVMKHQTCHYADKRYKCETCKFSSDTVEIMRNHILLHPLEERSVFRNGVSIGGVIQPLRKRLKSPKAESKGVNGERVKSPCSDHSIGIDTNVSQEAIVSPQTSPLPSKRVRKRKTSLNSTTSEPLMDLSLLIPEKAPEPSIKSPGPPAPGTRAATLISETEIRKVSPPPKKRFMEKVVAEREAAKLNELKATEQAKRDNLKEDKISNKDNAHNENKAENSTIDSGEVSYDESSEVKAASGTVEELNKTEIAKKEDKPAVKTSGRKPRARRSRLLFADEQSMYDEKIDLNRANSKDFEMDNRINDIKRSSSVSDFVDYDSEDFLKGFQKLNILHCPFCPFKTTGRSHGAKHNLAKHEKCHGMKARFICELCSFGTKYMDSYKKHKALHEENPTYKPRKCPPEMAAMPAAPVVPRRKGVVSKKTGVKQTVKVPKVAASAVAPVAPPAVGEKTKRRKGINFSKTPLKKFNLKCRYCPFQTGANYAAKYNLLRHEKAHFQNSAYKCDHCTFSSAEYRKFKMHVLLHVSGGEGVKKVKQETHKYDEYKESIKRVATRRVSKDSLSDTGFQAPGNVKEVVPASPVKAENVKLKGKGVRSMKGARKTVNAKRKVQAVKSELDPVKVETTVAPTKSTKQKMEPLKPKPDAVKTETIIPDNTVTVPEIMTPAQKKKKGAALALLKKKAQIARNIKKSLILSCKFCPFKTCGTSAAARYNLKLHEDCHFRVSTYRCEICSFTTKKFIVIKKHRLLHTESVNTDNPLNKLKCDACEFAAEDLRSLEQHKTEFHPSQKLDQEARLADTPPSMPSPEMKPEASGDLVRQQQDVTMVPAVPNVPAIATSGDNKQTKKMLEIPAELWWDAESLLYHCQWCDFTSKREHFFKVHLYCHQRKNVKFRCKGCGYGATRQAFLDHHYKEHHNEDVKNKTWATKEERAAVLKPKDLYTAVTERLKLKGLDETLIETFSPSKSKGKSQPSTPFLVPAVPPPKPSNSQPSFKRPNKPASNSPRAKRRRCHPIPAHAANPTGPEQRYLCSLCPFSTTSLEVQNNHEKKHLLPDQFSCPYCTYNTRTRVYLQKHIKLHFTASLQDEAVTMLPLDFTQNLIRTEPKKPDNWEVDTSNLGKAKRQTKCLPRKQCRFCDRLLPIDEMKYHEDRHLVGCAYLKFIDCGSPTHESEQS